MSIKLIFCSILSIIIFNKIQYFYRSPHWDAHTDPGNHTIVRTNSGLVRGQIAWTLFENRQYYSFRGIPYAAPPINDLRFRPPEPVRPWPNVRDCFDFGNVCMQKTPATKVIVGSEDCLFLDIYTPEIKPKNLRAVMLYIHGGAWYVGYGSILGPDFLINEDVIVVTINYRLGAFGFASLGSPDYSGLQGIKDQQMALKWINANIEYFGGDKTKVTIFGDSAGTLSSIFHMFAPESRGLYRRSIEMSSTFDIWSVFQKPDHMDEMYLFARKLNSSVVTYYDVVDVVMNANASLFVSEFPFNFFNNKIMPSMENHYAQQPLVSVRPKDLMLEGDLVNDVDIMTGFTTGEALFLTRGTQMVEEFIDRFHIQLPSIHFNHQYKSPEYGLAAQKIRDYYFPNGSAETLHNLQRLKSDVYQRYFIDRRIKLLAEKSAGRTYYYRFGPETNINYFKILIGAENIPGASHGDDVCYVSPCNYSERSLAMYNGIELHSLEYDMIKLVSGMYANFAKYGNPVTDDGLNFQPVRPGKYEFVDITNNGLYIGEDPFREESRFWDSTMAAHPELLTLYH